MTFLFTTRTHSVKSRRAKKPLASNVSFQCSAMKIFISFKYGFLIYVSPFKSIHCAMGRMKLPENSNFRVY